MLFPISGAHISPIYLALVGFLIGVLGGFFGVGGPLLVLPVTESGNAYATSFRVGMQPGSAPVQGPGRGRGGPLGRGGRGA